MYIYNNIKPLTKASQKSHETYFTRHTTIYIFQYSYNKLYGGKSTPVTEINTSSSIIQT